MSETTTCELCGTVNVGSPARCIACGSPLRQSGGEKRSLPKEEELDSAAGRATILEEVPNRLASPPTDQIPSSASAGPSMGPVQYAVRLLLPDGDRRSVDVGKRQVPVGSGLDHLGVTGDPRVLEREGSLYVDGDVLYVEPVAEATGIFRRLRGEEALQAGDVVLMGDVAALFTRLPPAAPVDPDRHVLGGSANTPCGRLVFLRRDGSPGPVHDLPAGKTILGRTDGHLNFPNDSRLSRRHARFFASDKSVTVEDLGSRNGTYIRIREKTVLDVGDALRIGAAGLQVRERS